MGGFGSIFKKKKTKKPHDYHPTPLQERIEMMEKGSILGMLALAVSDFTFCLLTLISTFYKVRVISPWHQGRIDGQV